MMPMTRVVTAAAAVALALTSPTFAAEKKAAAQPAVEAPVEAAPVEAAPAEAAPAEQPAAEAAPAAEQPAAAEAAAEPAAAEQAAASDAAPAATAISSKDLVIGTPVMAADGVQIGEVNRVTSDSAGKVSEIHVTAGGPAGLNAKVVSIPANMITAVGKPVKVSISAADAKKLPILDGGNG